MKTVGLCRVNVKDSDGHPRNIKGCDAMVPIHESREGDDYVFTANFPLDDPITYIHIQDVNPGDVIAIAMHKGSYYPDLGGFPISSRIVTGRNAKCKELLETMDKQEGPKLEGTVEIQGWLPFLADAHSKRIKIIITAKEIKLQTKLEKIKFVIPSEHMDEFEKYAALLHAEEERYLRRL